MTGVQTCALPILISTFAAFPTAVSAKSYTALKGESRISYHIHHPLHEVEGVSQDFNCTVELGNDTTRPQVHVKASIASFNSGNSNRDSHTLEILDAFKYPSVEFSADSAIRVEKGYRLFGQLTFHGVKRSVDFMVTPEYSKDRVHIKGNFMVKLSDFKLKRPTLLMIPTADDLKIDIDVAAEGP